MSGLGGVRSPTRQEPMDEAHGRGFSGAGAGQDQQISPLVVFLLLTFLWNQISGLSSFWCYLYPKATQCQLKSDARGLCSSIALGNGCGVLLSGLDRAGRTISMLVKALEPGACAIHHDASVFELRVETPIPPANNDWTLPAALPLAMALGCEVRFEPSISPLDR